MKIILILFGLLLMGCTHHSITIPVNGNTKTNTTLQYDIYQTLLKDIKCSNIEHITTKLNTYPAYFGNETWKVKACGYIYHEAIHYKKTKEKVYYATRLLLKEKIKNYHVKIYSLKEYKRFSSKLNKYEILWDTKSLKYLTKSKLPTVSKLQDIHKIKTILLDIKYNSLNKIISDHNFFNQYHLENFSENELETIIYHKNKALITFSSRGYDSSYRGFYLIILNKNHLTIFSLGNESACGGLYPPLQFAPTTGNYD
jgi:hypothetical protein